MENIAIIITKLNGGGAERCASNLSIELSKKYNVYLVVLDGRNITYPYEGNLIDLAIPDSHNFLDRVINVFKRVSVVKKLKKNHKIQCSISLLDGPNIVNTMSKQKDKVIVSVRNRLSGENVGKLRKKLITYCSKKSDLTVSLSKMVKKDLIEEFGIQPDKIVTVYNHCDPILLRSLSKNSPKPSYINKESVYIATMGRLNHQKGQWHLIRAFREVLKEIPNAKLLIIGEGELEQKLKQLATDLGIADQVIFTGFIKNPHNMLQYSEMFVFPSLYEGLGNVLLEALAFEMPIISADCIAGPREILAPDTKLDDTATSMQLEKYGILVPVMDAEHFDANEPLTEAESELTKAIIKLHYDEKLRRDYSSAASLRIKDFSKERIMQMWECCIEK